MSRRNAQSLIELSATKIALLDGERRIFYATPATESMLRHNSGSMIGKHVLDGVHPHDRAALDDMCDKVFAEPGSTHCVTFRYACGDGTFRHLRSTATNLLDNIQVSGVVLVLDDITEQKALEESLAQANRRKDDCIAILAHELRNPLAAIKNYIYLLGITGVQDATIREYLDTLDRQTNIIATLVNDLMDVAAFARGKVKLLKEPMLLCETMQKAAQTVRETMEERGHHFKVCYPPTPILMEADPTRIEQVLTNLLSNAAKYTEPGGTVEFAAHLSDGVITITVADTGIGIPPERLPHIFDLFHQEHGNRGGLGVGLALVKQFVELHGGTVKAESKGSCKGSKFTICLPSLVGGSGSCGTSEPKHAKRILVVEDNKDSAKSLATLLTLFGHKVRIAYTGKEAIGEINRFEPHVILCDIGLPEMNGFEVARHARMTHTRELKIVAMTDQFAVSPSSTEFDHFIPKPIHLPDLQRYLARVPA